MLEVSGRAHYGSSAGAGLRFGLIFVCAYLAVLFLVLQDTLFSMVYVWGRYQTYNHGYLIAPITLWLIWERRNVLDGQSASGSLPGLIALVLCGSVWFFGNIADVQIVQQFALVAMIVTGVWAIIGTSLAKSILFPLLYLFFMVPVGEALVPPLMEFTATFTVEAVRLSGIPVYREGLHFSLPSGSWSVINACSGVRYLIASIALGALFAYLNYGSLRKRFVFMIAAVIVPIIANGIRAYSIVMIGHFSGMELAVGVDHLIWGWAFFGFVMFLLFSIGSVWRDKGAFEEALKVESTATQHSVGSTFRLSATFCCVLIAAVSWPAAAKFVNSVEAPTHTNRVQVPGLVGAWHFTPETSWEWRPAYGTEDRIFHGAYLSDGTEIGLTLQQYISQEQGAEVVPASIPIGRKFEREWRIVGSSAAKLSLGDRDITVKRLELGGPNSQRLVVYFWYRVAGVHVAHPYVVKLLETLSYIRLRSPLSTRIFVVHEQDSTGANQKVAERFLDVSLEEIELALDTLQ